MKRSPWGLSYAVFGYISGFLASALVAAAWTAASGRSKLGVSGLVLTQIALWSGLVGASLLASRHQGQRSLSLDYGFRFRLSDVAVGMPLGVACQFVLLPLVYLPLQPFLDTDALSRPARALFDGLSGFGFGLLAVSVVIGAPLVEELFFRGLVLRSLAMRFGDSGAVVGSAVLFGLTHFQLLQFVGLAAFGVVLAITATRTGRLGVPVWTHVGFNLATMVVLAAER